MRRRLGSHLAVLLIACAALMATLSSAQAATSPPSPASPKTLDDLVQIYEVQSVPVDVLVVADTSSSMIEDGNPPPWPSVVEGYQALVDSLGPSDNLGLITFDSSAAIRLTFQPLATDADRETAKKQLPTTPTGTATDIGEGLDATLEMLKRSSTDLQLVFFMTDGKHSPSANSKYQAPGGAAWDALEAAGRDYAQANGNTLQVFGWGAGGASATDIGLVENVFPDAILLAIPTQQLPQFLESLSRTAERERVRPEVQSDLAMPIDAALDVPGQLTEDMEGTLTFTNPRQGLATKVDFKSLTVTEADGRAVAAEAQPVQFELAPGQSMDVPVMLHPADTEHGLITVGLRSDTRDWTVTVDAGSSLSPELTTLLATEQLATPDQTITPVQQPEAVQVGATWGITILKAVIIVVLLGLFLFLLFAFLKWFFVPPPLRGKIISPGQDEYRLRGKQVMLPNARIGTLGGDDEVMLFTKPRGQGKWTFIRRTKGAPTSGGADVPDSGTLLFGGEEILLNGSTFVFKRLDQ